MDKNKCCKKDHPDHIKELPRLKKIAGQINGIEKMITEQRYCVDILQQLQAVKSALSSLQANLLETHLSNCIKDALMLEKEDDVEKKILELKNLFKKNF